MPLPTPESAGTSVVLRGSFNPAIFQPAWLWHQNLISEGQLEAVEVKVISPQIASYQVERTQVQVAPDLFQVAADGEPIEDVLRDLTVGTFRVLRHTPITMVGINRYGHYPTRSEDAWHAVGNTLVPKGFWQSFTKDPGLQTLTIRGVRDDKFAGWLDISIQPSARIPIGVFINIHDHIQVADIEHPEGADQIIDALEANWDPARDRVKIIRDRIGELL
jgi:hypothetical protein